MNAIDSRTQLARRFPPACRFARRSPWSKDRSCDLPMLCGGCEPSTVDRVQWGHRPTGPRPRPGPTRRRRPPRSGPSPPGATGLRSFTERSQRAFRRGEVVRLRFIGPRREGCWGEGVPCSGWGRFRTSASCLCWSTSPPCPCSTGHERHEASQASGPRKRALGAGAKHRLSGQGVRGALVLPDGMREWVAPLLPPTPEQCRRCPGRPALVGVTT